MAKGNKLGSLFCRQNTGNLGRCQNSALGQAVTGEQLNRFRLHEDGTGGPCASERAGFRGNIDHGNVSLVVNMAEIHHVYLLLHLRYELFPAPSWWNGWILLKDFC